MDVFNKEENKMEEEQNKKEEEQVKKGKTKGDPEAMAM